MQLKNTVFVVFALCCAACARHSEPTVTLIDGFTQGGTYHIAIADSVSGDAKPWIDSLLKRVESSVSLFDSTSLLSRVNRNQTDTLDAMIESCVTTAERISDETQGAYDITIKPLTAAYGFAGDSLKSHPNVDSLLQLVGYRKIRIELGRLIKADPRMQLDLNSIAQGATVDLLAKRFAERGWHNYIIEVGGEVYCSGTRHGKAWRVGIDRPFEGNVLPGADLQVILGLSDEGLATSGNYRKFYKTADGRKVVHTIDARSGQPVVSNLLSATVVASTSTLADAYGTVCMVLGLEQSKAFLAARPQLQAYLVYADSTGKYCTYVTPGLEARIQRK